MAWITELAGWGTGPRTSDVPQLRRYSAAQNGLTSRASPLTQRREPVPTSTWVTSLFPNHLNES
jgi:hypothetical protein